MTLAEPGEVSLGRRVGAEVVGTSFLTMAVIGSGIAATRLSPDDVGLQLLENSLITGGALIALIVTFQPVSAAFNPIVTWLEVFLGRLGGLAALALTCAQVAGAVIGAVLANLMFDLDAVSLSAHTREGAAIWLAEIVATLGLVLVIFGPARSGRSQLIAFTVGGYVTAAYWFTSSTSFANPALTLARSLSDSFAGIAPESVAGFLAAQVVGGLAGLGLVRLVWP